jgi:hypothetical protein
MKRIRTTVKNALLASDAWTNTQSDWQDITETYKP